MDPDEPLSFRLIMKTYDLTKTPWVRGKYVDRKTVEGSNGQTGRGYDLLPIRSEEWSPKQGYLLTVRKVRSTFKGNLWIEVVDGGRS